MGALKYWKIVSSWDSAPYPAGELTALPDPFEDGNVASCPSPIISPPLLALQASPIFGPLRTRQ